MLDETPVHLPCACLDAEMLNRLTLVPGSAPAHGAFFWEPAVDGELLRTLLIDPSDDLDAESRATEPVGDHIPVLVHSWPAAIVDDALVLLGERPSELPGGRVAFYVCPSCGDLGCGAVSAVVERTGSQVIWRDFGWDRSFDAGEGEIRYEGGPFVFDRDQHDGELRRFVETFDAVRASLPEPAAARQPRMRRLRVWRRPGGRGR